MYVRASGKARVVLHHVQEQVRIGIMTAVEAQWSPLKLLILGEDPQLRLYAEVSVWYKKIEMFRKGEDQRMFVQEPTSEDLAVHRSLLRRLIADGEHLVCLIDQIGLPENVEAITPQSVSATLEAIRADYRGWHEPMPAQLRERILHQVFRDVA